MTSLQNLVDSVRTRVSAFYATPLGRYAPTPQVLSAALAALIVKYAGQYVPGLDISAEWAAGVAALVVAYLVGPPVNLADVLTPDGVIYLDANDGSIYQEPTVDGPYVGPDPPDKPAGDV